jgi:hypothetical protein
MNMRWQVPLFSLAIMVAGWCAAASARGGEAEPISPQQGPIHLFNGKNLDGLYTWLNDSRYDDPRKVFTVENGQLHISGDGLGYIATKHAYKDYHLVLEYRWGGRTWQNRKNAARDSGLIVHCIPPDGSFHNVFMGGIEAQVIEGGTGDILVVVPDRSKEGSAPMALSANVVRRGNAIVWDKQGKRETFSTFTRVDWFARDPGWKDVRGFRGPHDLDSPGTQWTRLDVICDGGHIVYKVNGTLANEAFQVTPSAGKILIQSELAEVCVRRFDLLPLTAHAK